MASPTFGEDQRWGGERQRSTRAHRTGALNADKTISEQAADKPKRGSSRRQTGFPLSAPNLTQIFPEILFILGLEILDWKESGSFQGFPNRVGTLYGTLAQKTWASLVWKPLKMGASRHRTFGQFNCGSQLQKRTYSVFVQVSADAIFLTPPPPQISPRKRKSARTPEAPGCCGRMITF